MWQICNNRMASLWNYLNTHDDALSFVTFLLAMWNGHISNQNGRVFTLFCSMMLESDVCCICWAIFTNIKINSMLNDWLPTWRMRYFGDQESQVRRDINAVGGAHIPGQLTTFTSADTMEGESQIKNHNLLRCPIEMLSISTHGSNLSNLTLNLKKGLVVILQSWS